MHFQPKSGSFWDILRPFVASQFFNLDPSDMKTMAAVAKWPHRRITIDGSGKLANAGFIRLEREFAADATYEAMAHQIRADEEGLFQAMDVEEEIL